MGSEASAEFKAQWGQPGDVFTVLLIVGGDVIQLSLAAATGRLLTPVAFSFGWVAYAVSAVVSAIGDNRLVRCAPEVSLKVINLQTGYHRANQSWLLGRLFKTYPFWMPLEVTARLASGPGDEETGNGASGPVPVDRGAAPGLCVAVYRWAEGVAPGRPGRDWVWWSGFLVSALQLGIAAVPWGRHGNWAVFLSTAGGTLLALASASLPQWHREKWHARRRRKDVALTLGNGSRHVVIVLGADQGLDLEDLAAGRAPDLVSTRVFTSVLAVLWLVLLITCTSIRTNTWYLLAVGVLGMLHNLIIAGAPRSPASLGLPIQLASTTEGAESDQGPGVAEIYTERKVMWTLMKLEDRYKGFGRALVSEFFPGELRKWEQDWWNSSDVEERRRLLRQARETPSIRPVR
ncbi:hypothetical protein G6O67_007696 [Ophiocordyceps sinensis]|uniref:Uncharacterized protein n=2 Tax=Ophiocordyceps sinensis TaxID=72228 RepID=A0A8H4LUP7_9HYPO|nr:hypothetical protein OCS_02810 [Ophiocordyceps sinensis CO18]KAF4505783.1 hypothetical protein G6O67_007696 [Ophiocordyceps sinensis]